MKTKLLILKKKNLICVFTFLIALVVSFQTNAQDFSHETKKVASDRGAVDYFGSYTAIDGDYAIVSARGYDDDATPVNNIGVVYFYMKDGNGVWQETQVLTASDYHANDYANSVTISGNYAAVGVSSHDYDENDANLLAGAGAVFIFERDVSGIWSEIKKIVTSDRTAGDSFGISVSMSGRSLLVGATGQDTSASGNDALSNSGAAYMITRQVSNDEWIETQKIVSSDRAADDYFGISVAVYGLSTGLNNTVVIGAFREDENIVGSTTRTDAGSAYIFSPTSNWTQTQKITATDRTAGDWFGRSVAIYQNTIVVGATEEDQSASGSATLASSGSAYIFEKSGTWSQTQKITASNRAVENKFGYRVAVYNDLILVGTDVPATEEGQAYLFQKATTWSQIENFTAFDGAANNAYGSVVAINNGNVFIGAIAESFDAEGGNEMFSAGAIYIYQDPADILGINTHDFINDLGFSIYTNNNLLTLLNPAQAKVKDVEIYTLNGQLLKYVALNNNILANEIKISELSTGIYIIAINTDKSIIKKFIKK